MRLFRHSVMWKQPEPDPFIRPEHVCRPPRSRLFGGVGPKYIPENPEECPIGTLWICDCGRAWGITGGLMCWERRPKEDVSELMT